MGRHAGHLDDQTAHPLAFRLGPSIGVAWLESQDIAGGARLRLDRPARDGASGLLVAAEQADDGPARSQDALLEGARQEEAQDETDLHVEHARTAGPDSLHPERTARR